MSDYKRKSPVTLPNFKIELDTPYHFQIKGEIYKAEDRKDQKMEAPYLVRVLNLETDTEGTIVLGKVLQDAIAPLKIGTKIEVIKLPKKEGQKAFNYSVWEIE